MNYSSQEEYNDAMGAAAMSEAEAQNDAAYAEYEMLNDAMPATSIVALFDTNKEQRSSFVMGILKALDNGKIDPLKVHKQVKSMEQIIAMLTDKKDYPTTATAYNKHLLDAADKQSGKTFELYGGKWTIKEVGSKLDYSQCNDSELLTLEAAAKAATDALKERQTYLQNLPAAGIETVDKESGELITIYKPSKSSTTALTVSLK